MGVKCPVDDGREFIRCEWFKLLPSVPTVVCPIPIIEEPSDVTIDCWCWWCCWFIDIWSRGGDIGSALIFTGAGDDDGGGVLFETAKWGIPLFIRIRMIKILECNHLTNYLVCCSELRFWCDEFHDVIIFKSDDDMEKSCAPNVLTG